MFLPDDPDHLFLTPGSAQFSTRFMVSHMCQSGQSRLTMVAKKFVWPGFRKQVGMWAKSWLHGLKVHRHTTAPVGQFTTASCSHSTDHSFRCSDRTRVRPRVTLHYRIVVSIVSTSSSPHLSYSPYTSM